MGLFSNPKKSVEYICLSLIAIVLFSVFSVHQGQDVNWDQQNYHIYSVYALIHGRIGFDVMPGGIQSYFNPLLYFPFYFSINTLPPKIAGAIIGGLQGLNFIVLYYLANKIILSKSSFIRFFLAFICAIVGVTGPLFLSEIGTSMVDDFSSIFVTLSIIIALTNNDKGTIFKRFPVPKFFLSGLILGLAVGLKLTNAVFAVGMATAIVITFRSWSKCWRLYFDYSIGGMIGLLISGGYLAMKLWEEFGNPFFPFYNKIFKSKFYPLINFTDTRFLPKSVVDSLSYPFKWLFDIQSSAEMPFRDARFAIFSIIILFVFIYKLSNLINKNRKTQSLATTDTTPLITSQNNLFFITFYLSSYALWMQMFSIQRYLIPLEVLSGIALISLIDCLPIKSSTKIFSIIALSFVIISFVKPIDWGHLKWADKWFNISLPENLNFDGTIYLMPQSNGMQNISFVIPYLNINSRYLRLDESDGLNSRIVKIIKENTDHPIRYLVGNQINEDDIAAFKRFGLKVNPQDCATITTRIKPLFSCALLPISHHVDSMDLLKLPVDINFNQNLLPGIVGISGISNREDWGRWSDGKEVKLTLAGHLPSQFMMTITARAFGPNIGKPFKIRIGNTEKSLTFNEEIKSYNLFFNNTLSSGAASIIQILIPEPASPSMMNLSPDTRKLGLGLVSFKIDSK